MFVGLARLPCSKVCSVGSSRDRPIADESRDANDADVRRQLIDAATVEFARNGFAGASTRAIAVRAGAHQPQINYHFSSKEALWRAVVDDLFTQLSSFLEPEGTFEDPVDEFRQWVLGLVLFSAERPELSRLIMHEAASYNDRMNWLVDSHVGPYLERRVRVWSSLKDRGLTEAIVDEFAYFALIGAITIPFCLMPHVERVHGPVDYDRATLERHAEGLVRAFLPGLDS
ncbi:MAG: TetR/AcrR family transcriptional regulator [Actinobacteria bacterium]|nr:TetR/AcrR family transcriptional regulator [Actinomycetota bacterium]